MNVCVIVPCGLLNIGHYFDSAIEFMDHAVEEQFISPDSRALVIIDDDPALLIKKFLEYRPHMVDKAAWALQFLGR